MELETEKRLVLAGVVANTLLAVLTGLSGLDVRLIALLMVFTFLVLWRLLAVSHRIRKAAHPLMIGKEKISHAVQYNKISGVGRI